MNIPRPWALWGGIIAVIIGAYLLHNAYEARGLSRPFWTKFLPG